MNNYHYLIIGNGAAGMSAAEVIRKRDTRGRITIVTDEPYLFYSRPGIAYYLAGQVPGDQLISRRESFYRDHRMDLRFGSIKRLDLEAKLAFFDNDEPIAYDVVLLATGATAVRPPFVGGDLDGVLTFDNMDDVKKIIAHGRRAKVAVVVGGGITAMEFAEGLQHRGVRTILLQRKDRVWPRLFDPRESEIIETAITREGVKLLYKEEISEILGKKGKVRGVRLKSGKEIECQIVGVAIGVRPNLKVVEGLSLEQDRGLLVNPSMQTNVPSVFAAGDIAQVYDRWTRKHNLDVLWPSAINEGRAAGSNMVDFVRSKDPQFHYRKGSPFNAALLFGVHLTVIGQVGGQPSENGEELLHMSRGASTVWTSPFSSNYRSAWDIKGPNSIRIVMSNNRMMGALLMGQQQLADPLRRLIENEVDLESYQDQLLVDGADLPEKILRAWQNWHQSWQ
jgi:NAD(P)H-nitrite reductase large subunit